MMTYEDYEKEYEDFCNNERIMTGQEIISWVFSRINAPHKELSFCAKQVREKYIDTDRHLGKKVYYDLYFWTDGNGKLGECFYGEEIEYVQVKRDLEKSPRRY